MTDVPQDQLEYHGVYLLFIGGVLLLVLLLAIAAVHQAITDRRHRAAADPPPAFVCPDCGARSWHPEDGRQGWCGRCRAYTGRPAGLTIPTDDRRTA